MGPRQKLAADLEYNSATVRSYDQTAMPGALSAEERITGRVLMHNARIPGGFLPKAPFYLYTFADPGDQPIAIVDTVTTDLVLTKRGEVARYTGIYDRLREAALSTEDSIAFLTEVAYRLTDQTGSGT